MRKICASEDLKDPERVLVFDIDRDNFITGFVFRFHGKLYAYRNQCPHNGSELDWVRGQFFDEEGALLVCATHGARFDPCTGVCVAGPCVKQSLIPIPITLQGGTVYARV